MVIGLRHLPLIHTFTPGKCALDGVDDTAELTEIAISGGLDDSPLVPGDERVEELLGQSFETRVGSSLVVAHETAVSNEIRLEDGG